MEQKSFTERLQQGDEQAFKQLFDTEYDALLAYMNTLTRNHDQAEDLTQQAFFKFWEKRETIKPEQDYKHYLFSMGHNLFIDYYRRHKIHIEIIADLKQRALQDQFLEESEYLQERLEKLLHIIDQLPPRCQEILKLSKLEGLTYDQVAAQLNISKKTVEGQMRLAYQKIREAFDQDDPLLLFLLVRALEQLPNELQIKNP